MRSRFDIPERIKNVLEKRNRSLFQLKKVEFEDVKHRIKKLRGELHKPPHITVAVVAFNEERNLFSTLYSIAQQNINYRVEVLVIDNNSTDNTIALARQCGVRIVLESKQGVANARQRGLLDSRGRYYVSCDADTLYPSNWLSTLVHPLILNSSVSVTYSLHSLIDERNQYGFGLYAYQYAKLLFVYLRAIKRGQLNCGGASMAFRKEEALNIGGYNTQLQRGSDGFIALQLSIKGKLKMISDVEAIVYTSNRRMLKDGTVWEAFLIRLKYGLRHLFSFFSTQKIPAS